LVRGPHEPDHQRLAGPDLRTRLVIAVACGCIAVALEWFRPLGGLAPDFDSLWCATREMLAGKNPYHVVGPAATCRWQWGLVYPITALFVLTPLAPLSLTAAHAIWAFASGAVFGFAITRDSLARLPLIASAPFVTAIVRGQWSPLLVAASIYPALSAFLVAKPTLGAALWISRPSKAAVVWALVLVTVGFLVLPSWPVEWLAGSRTAQFRTLILAPGGVLLLLACARWRLPEGRLMVALALTPHSTFAYEALYPLTVTRTVAQAVVLTGLSWVAFVAPYVIAPRQTYEVWVGVSGASGLLFIYLPALVLVLRRPNEGAVPGWVERRVSRWPRWVRGTPAEMPRL
jgi:hypothetical protein